MCQKCHLATEERIKLSCILNVCIVHVGLITDTVRVVLLFIVTCVMCVCMMAAYRRVEARLS